MNNKHHTYADLVWYLRANLHCSYGQKWGRVPILVELIKRGFVRYPNIHDCINMRAKSSEQGAYGHLFHAPVFYMFSSKKVN